jgi:hypothetical protein
VFGFSMERIRFNRIDFKIIGHSFGYISETKEKETKEKIKL